MIADLGAMSELDDLSEGNSSVGTKESDSESTKSSEKEDLPEVRAKLMLFKAKQWGLKFRNPGVSVSSPPRSTTTEWSS